MILLLVKTLLETDYQGKELLHTSEVAIGITFTGLDSTSIGSEAIITVAMRWRGR